MIFKFVDFLGSPLFSQISMGKGQLSRTSVSKAYEKLYVITDYPLTISHTPLLF